MENKKLYYFGSIAAVIGLYFLYLWITFVPMYEFNEEMNKRANKYTGEVEYYWNNTRWKSM